MRSRNVLVGQRCGCVDVTGRQFGAHCPRLVAPDHGSWYYAVQVPTVGGRRARKRSGGFGSREEALDAGQAVLDAPADRVAADAWTVSRWLRHWLGVVEPSLRPSTVNGYRDHVYRYLIPALGGWTLDELTVPRTQTCFDLLAKRRTRWAEPISPVTVDRIRATLRSALNTAVREGVMATNPVTAVRIAHPTRPHPVVWTDERVAVWRRTGKRPTVAVWTVEQFIRFLYGVKNDRLAGLWWLVALRGLRRGEITGLQRSDLDKAAREVTVHSQNVALPGQLYYGPPKSRASNRTVALDAA